MDWSLMTLFAYSTVFRRFWLTWDRLSEDEGWITVKQLSRSTYWSILLEKRP